MPLSFHTKAQKAAEAAECARKVSGSDEGFWKMHDKLFENQDKLDVDDLKVHAEAIGLNVKEFSECLDSGEMEEEVLKDLADASNYGISGTPAFFINGIPVSGAQPFSVFQQLIEAELAKVQ